VADSERVVSAVRKFLSRHRKDETVELDTSLFADGIGLDSLETAELSVLLEDELGRDPFSEGADVESVADIVEFYDEGKSPA